MENKNLIKWKFPLIALLLMPLLLSSSCEEDESLKMPGSKPEMLMGKWVNYDRYYADLFNFILVGNKWTTYEFTKTGGSRTVLKYNIEKDEYEEPIITNFINWSYDGECIYFLVNDFGTHISRGGRSIHELTSDSMLILSDKYYKIK